MDPVTLGLLGSSVIGGLFGLGTSALSIKGQQDTNKASLREADINRQWQTDMLNNAHLREVEDLRRAGLNPILSANHGAGSGTGALPILHNPYAGVGDNMTNSVKQFSEIALSEAMTRKASYEAQSAKSQSVLNEKIANEELSNQGTALRWANRYADIVGRIANSVGALRFGITGFSGFGYNAGKKVREKRNPSRSEYYYKDGNRKIDYFDGTTVKKYKLK